MAEAEYSVALCVARNDGFEYAHHAVLDKLAKLLGSLAGNDGTFAFLRICLQDSAHVLFEASRPKELLWEEMVSHHQIMIEKDFIPDLRASFKAHDAACTGHGSFSSSGTQESVAKLSDLPCLLSGRVSSRMQILE